ncbi:predicted protein [Bathycoccus prasinos]|uniref:Uncharacterized protein n=1 Tax=Bathycoccus prasinos TaxID=41875 RepID=K8EQ96_9CHLO|nr:predicted protein [Bathycoccus prasinos]CCO20397.1 predicted protein [Bathycoccus prasinos]|eukprot:XP_007508293.1 predicted protein [Bathycoccus prasinos]
MSIQKALPVLVPDGFYQIKEMPFIGSNTSTAFFTTVLYFLSALAFCGLLYLYSSDSQSINESTITKEWNLNGYDSCIPLQGDPRYNIYKNYSTCLTDTTLKLDVSNLVPSTETKSIEQSEYILGGFMCKPKQIDDHYGITASFDECVDLLDKTVDPSSLIEPYSGDPTLIHFPQQYLKLTASDGAYGDSFGTSIAFDGNTALIGAIGVDDNGSDSGSVYVFTRTGTDDSTWTETKKLTVSDGEENDHFGRSIAFDGNTALIGVEGIAVYVFTRTGTDDSTWTETKKLTASDGAYGDSFGTSIAFDGNTALIGAIGDDDKGYESGSVYGFTRTGTDDSTWTETKKLTASDCGNNRMFGSLIAFHGNTALLGATFDDAGSVYVFTRTGTDDSTWTETKKLTVSDDEEEDYWGDYPSYFGRSIAFDGNTALIGATGIDHPGDLKCYSAAVYVFTRTGTDDSTWTETKKLTASDGACRDSFGRLIAFDGITALIGAIGVDDNGSDSGSVYVFTRTGTDDSTWTETKKLTASDGEENDHFGPSIAFDGNTALIGATGDDDKGYESGSVYVFSSNNVLLSQNSGSLVFRDYNPTRYTDFLCNSTLGICAAPCYEYAPFSILNSRISIQSSALHSVSDSCDGTGFSVKYGTKYCTTDPSKAAAYFDCRKNAIGTTSLCEFAKLNAPFECTAPCFEYAPFANGVPIEATILNSVPDNTCDATGYSVKDGSKFCTNLNATTISNYFECRANEIGVEAICEFTKSNAPYECQRKVPLPPLQRLSLAYANTLILYSGLASLFAGYMYRVVSKSVEEENTREMNKFDVKKSIQKALPVLVPDGFYQIKKMPFIGSNTSTAFFTTVLYFLSALAFCGLLYLYSSDSQSINESTITEEWNLNGYDSCIPLQGDPHYNIYKNYSTCLTDTTLKLDVSNLVPSTETKSIEQSEYILGGFMCKPKQIDDHYGITASFDECVDLLDKTVDPSSLIEPYSGDPTLIHFPQQYLKLTASDGAYGDSFGTSIAFDGNTALIGAIGDDDSGSDSGSVYVFTRTGTDDSTWTETKKLTASDGEENDHFGTSIAFDGNTALIGAHGDDDNYSDSGSVYVFTRTGTDDSTWTETKKLTVSDDEEEDYWGDYPSYFGRSIAFDGNTALIGATGIDHPGDLKCYSAAVYVFTRTGTDDSTWTETKKLTASDGACRDSFGRLIAFDGITALIGAIGVDDNGSDSGSVYVFTRTGTDDSTWTETKKLTASDGEENDHFGPSIAFDGNTALIKNYGDDGNGYESGSVYVFSSNNVLLSQNSGSLVFRDYNPTRYTDFLCNSTLGICAAPCYEYAPFSILNSRISIQSSALHSVSDSCDGTGFSVKYGTKYCTTDPSKAAAYFDCRKNAIGTTSLCEFAKLNAPFECTAPCFEYAPFANGVPIEATILNSVPDNTCDATGYSVKDGSKFCTNLNATTISNYFECRANEIGVEAICEFTKSNAPYECQRKVPLPPLQRLSLAYANTLILYSGLASLFAGYMYRVVSKSVEEENTREMNKFDVKKSIQKALPVLVPDGFYQIKKMPFIGSNTSTAFFTTVLYFLSALAFCGLLYLYSSDSQSINESTITKEWNLNGYDSCIPLQGDPRYNIYKNYSTCLTDTTLKLDVSNLVPSTETKSIEQSEYILGGFMCKPKQIDDHYGITASFDECVDLLDKTVDPSSLIEPYSGDPTLIHFPQQYLKLTASDGAYGDSFGTSIAFDGNTALIGAIGVDDNGSDSGSVYVFTRTGTDDSTWTETKKLTVSDGENSDIFGSSIAFDGNTALIGATWDRSVAVYVFTRTGTDDSTWTETKKLTASDGAYGNSFGTSIAFDGNTALIGATLDDAGSVYAFTRTGTDDSTWTETKKLTASDGEENDHFGTSIAFDGNTALIGVYNYVLSYGGSGGFTSDSSGSVYVFTRTGTDDSTWTETKKLTASDGEENDHFGPSIAFDGNTALIGATGDDDKGYESGSVYVFSSNNVLLSQNSGSLVFRDYNPTRYTDFLCNSTLGICAAPCYEYAPFSILNSRISIQSSALHSVSDSCDGTGFSVKYGTKYCTTDPSKAAAYFDCRKNAIGTTSLCEFAKLNAPFECTAPCFEYAPFANGVPIEATILNSVPDNTCDATGYSVKDGSKFCTNLNATTISNYFECRANEIGVEAICEFTKSNAPYECQRKVPLPPLQRLSLAYANTLILYSGLASLFAGYLYRFPSQIEVEDSDDF